MMASRKPRASNPPQHSRTLRAWRHGPLGRRATILLLFLSACAVWGISPRTAPGQEEKHKVPVLSKINSGTTDQAFDGIVQSLDLKRKILSVNTVQGHATEIFPIHKNTEVVTANGARRELDSLKPGTNVLVHYEQKGDHRSVKQIMIVTAAPKAAKKTAPPS